MSFTLDLTSNLDKNAKSPKIRVLRRIVEPSSRVSQLSAQAPRTINRLRGTAHCGYVAQLVRAQHS